MTVAEKDITVEKPVESLTTFKDQLRELFLKNRLRYPEVMNIVEKSGLLDNKAVVEFGGYLKDEQFKKEQKIQTAITHALDMLRITTNDASILPGIFRDILSEPNGPGIERTHTLLELLKHVPDDQLALHDEDIENLYRRLEKVHGRKAQIIAGALEGAACSIDAAKK